MLPIMDVYFFVNQTRYYKNVTPASSVPLALLQVYVIIRKTWQNKFISFSSFLVSFLAASIDHGVTSIPLHWTGSLSTESTFPPRNLNPIARVISNAKISELLQFCWIEPNCHTIPQIPKSTKHDCVLIFSKTVQKCIKNTVLCI